MNIKKSLVRIALVGALALTGCDEPIKPTSNLTLPDFVVKHPNDTLHYHEDGFTYKPYTIQSSMSPNLTFLEGVIAERNNEMYIFFDPMVDGRLLDIKSTNNSEGYFGRQNRLPESMKSTVDSAGNGADVAYKLFRKQLCDAK